MFNNIILVVAEPVMNKEGREINFEMVGKAHSLSLENHAKVITLMFEPKSAELEITMKQLECENFLLCELDYGTKYTQYAQAVVNICQQYQPSLVMFAGTILGKSISATVATRLNGGLTADCIDIQIGDDGKYFFSRAAMGSSMIAHIRCVEDCIQMCTVKRGIFEAVKKDKHSKIQIENYQLDTVHSDKKTLLVHAIEPMEKELTKNIEKKHIFFGIGRGVHIQDIPKLIELAEYYNAEYVCTRSLVEEGIFDRSRQVGQSGIAIKPDLYIAFGISGASQHMVGLSNAKVIVAINNAKDAKIFNYADYSVINDTHDIISCMYSQIIEQ